MRTRPLLIPNPYSTYEEAERYRHEDLRELPTHELEAEETLVRSELARQIHFRIDRPYGRLDDVRNECDWFDERLKRIATERRRREGQR